MITHETAGAFTKDWIEAFNSHEIEAILEHYADDVEFYSPFIKLLQFNEEGFIRNKTELKRYFETGLQAYPDLHFQLHNFFTGVDSIVIYYTSVNGRLAAETFQLNKEGKAISVFCHYTNDRSTY